MLVEVTNVVPDLQMLLWIPHYVAQLLEVVQGCQGLRKGRRKIKSSYRSVPVY
jgi:hypothetical protein